MTHSTLPTLPARRHPLQRTRVHALVAVTALLLPGSLLADTSRSAAAQLPASVTALDAGRGGPRTCC